MASLRVSRALPENSFDILLLATRSHHMERMPDRMKMEVAESGLGGNHSVVDFELPCFFTLLARDLLLFNVVFTFVNDRFLPCGSSKVSEAME
mmetsp:Transcript_27273/g.41245  ORF Transcript_27273/g.41245 Transcript_27273/m.41245 type:complete len:93 (+) Transcript_27273:2219-2497(+)